MVTPQFHKGFMSLLAAVIIAATLAGCSTTFIPISWGMRDKVLQLSQQDEVLKILFRRYDPERKTLRVDGASFDVVDMPHQDWRFEGAYRREYRLIYRNLDVLPADSDLRNILVHEMAHHIWANFLTKEQKEGWCRYLQENPSRWQAMVRNIYPDARSYDDEDFAYAVEFPRKADIDALARLGIITENEMRQWSSANELPEPPESQVRQKVSGAWQ
jgi:hypothetical protein